RMEIDISFGGFLLKVRSQIANSNRHLIPPGTYLDSTRDQRSASIAYMTNSVLAKTRVIHLTTNVPGPATAARLAEAGAKVTKVESPAGDGLAIAAPHWYETLHRGQNIVKIDLKQAEGLKKMDELLAS